MSVQIHLSIDTNFHHAAADGRNKSSGLRRALALESKDRLLLEMALSGRMTLRQIAGLLEIEPGTVSRRVHRLINRLYDPVVVALLEHPGRLAEEFRQLGIEYFVQKQPIQPTRRQTPALNDPSAKNDPLRPRLGRLID